ncbi:MAG: NAD(P)H-hydrate dehydratase [Verrucomicrobia bacterium CG_4_10_14_3_um_filter_43_23]|nr:MAG: NAD(P)H-hydrate dehydratase [Verrucomicrobia bacterium CG22_combo_CG10-13_8_21_14_all_43_17]PIX58490.1 MAG: NAD(P)H-hydrate dehydratase [Verrucomicrobia bacterium CG_4_10_14_3_um_filter_43_23]PIY62240.1 MAG: NAD(P)H-hydrate dehydratase [Verrucomicrobia bacterium CG_4_10_14_0_8_um_filter_43_34]PJA44296.1 MAG: NAD(P)H-hydrate dehydratase [Verrucomicrobia bacterium CG_4_9_14_3_um_filter_43_20]
MIFPLSHPVLTCAESGCFEEKLLGGDENGILAAMKKAGQGVGLGILQDFQEIKPFPQNAKVLVLSGKGHNGGDALIAAHTILRQHPQVVVEVMFVFGKDDLKHLVQKAFDELNQAGKVTVLENVLCDTSYDVCIDGALGMAFHLPLKTAFVALLEKINQHPNILLRAAVDLPSGLGDESANIAFRADFTYATGIAKKPVFEEKNKQFVGRIRYLDIGFFQNSQPESEQNILLPGVLDKLRRLRDPQSYKRTYGHLFIVAGSRRMPGALLMAVKAAVHSGVGLVTVIAPDSVARNCAPHVPEAMWLPCPETSDGWFSVEGKAIILKTLSSASAVLIGPGIGREDETKQLFAQLVRDIKCPIVIDADALMPEIIDALAGGQLGIITPHLGEFNRIRQTADEAYSFEKLASYSKNNPLVTVLKGSITKVAYQGKVYLSPFGGPVLARGGSGDILSGLCGGLLAQQPSEALNAACQAVVLHGSAADAMARERGQTGISTTEIIPYLSKILHG